MYWQEVKSPGARNGPINDFITRDFQVQIAFAANEGEEKSEKEKEEKFA